MQHRIVMTWPKHLRNADVSMRDIRVELDGRPLTGVLDVDMEVDDERGGYEVTLTLYATEVSQGTGRAEIVVEAVAEEATA